MKINFLFLAMLIAVVANAQTVNPATVFNPSDAMFSMPLFMTDINGRPLREMNYSDIEGHPFLLEQWNRGSVKFQDGKFARDIPLQFDLQNNRLYFKRNDERFEFVNPVSAFTITYLKGNDSVMVLYRSGYPSIERYSEATFYEVLAEGKYQLLRHNEKQIQEYKFYSGATKKRFVEKDQLYVFLPTGKMARFKKDKESIIGLFPEHADTINQLISEKKLKLKKDEDITMLFMLLNLK